MPEILETVLTYTGAIVALASVLSPALRKGGEFLYRKALETPPKWDDPIARRSRDVLFSISDWLDMLADWIGALGIKGKAKKE